MPYLLDRAFCLVPRPELVIRRKAEQFGAANETKESAQAFSFVSERRRTQSAVWEEKSRAESFGPARGSILGGFRTIEEGRSPLSGSRT